MISRFTIDRMTIAALAVAATLPFLAISPVQAGTVDCAAQAEAIAASAATASDPKAAAKALRTARVAAKICAEGNGHEAAKKFSLARTQLGDNIQLAERR
jgi:hypothetical protein